MEAETWQIIAAVVVALLVLGAVIWLIFSQRDAGQKKKSTSISPDEAQSLKNDHREFGNSIESLREKQGLLNERSERYDRSIHELRESLSQLEANREGRNERLNTMDKNVKELQEQIYEIRSEQKVLMQRQDRLERRLGELGDTPGESTTRDGNSPSELGSKRSGTSAETDERTSR